MSSHPAQQSQPSRAAARRRQRSTRLITAVLLLVLAAAVVVAAIVTGSVSILTAAAVSAVALGAAATRITSTELALARREAARDRAEQSQAYTALTRIRTGENVAFASAMTTRVEQQERALGELEDALGSAQKRAAEATRLYNAEVRRAELAEQDNSVLATRLEDAEQRATDAGLRVTELEQELDVLRAERDAWQAPLRKHA